MSNDNLFDQPQSNNNSSTTTTGKKKASAYINMYVEFNGEKKSLIPTGIPLTEGAGFGGVLLETLRKASPEQREALCIHIVKSIRFDNFFDADVQPKESDMSMEDLLKGFGG